MSTVSAIKREDDGGASAESKGSSAPLLNKDQPDIGSASTENDASAKPRKRDFWKMGKKPEEQATTPIAKSSVSQLPPVVGLRPSSPFRINDPVGGAASPHRGSQSNAPGSPGLAMTSAVAAAASMPRPHSPASSMIFERNVQDETHPPELSPQIPAHVITENHIPPALDASAEAITNSRLDPDEVEIITHATHQPAAVTITGATADQSMSSSTVEELPGGLSGLPAAHRPSEPGHDDISNYGSLDSADVRRLSFISFADVVHAEQDMIAGEQRRDSAAIGSNPALADPRSPSPMRSPVSSQAFGTSPPTSVATSAKGFEGSPIRGMRTTGSPPPPGQASPLPTGELNIETMRQALRRTGSGDLSGVRSAPMSAVGEGENFGDKAFR